MSLTVTELPSPTSVRVLVLVLTGCEMGKSYTVFFDTNYVGGAEIPAQTVSSGKTVRLFAENNNVVFSCLREYTMA